MLATGCTSYSLAEVISSDVTLRPQGGNTVWTDGSETLIHEVNGNHIEIRYLQVVDGCLAFKLSVENLSGSDYLIDPAAIHLLAYDPDPENRNKMEPDMRPKITRDSAGNITGEKVTDEQLREKARYDELMAQGYLQIQGIDPERVIQEIDAALIENEKDYERSSGLNLFAGLLGVGLMFLDPSSGGDSVNASLSSQAINESSTQRIRMILLSKKDFFENHTVRKTTLKQGQKVEGIILFPIPVFRSEDNQMISKSHLPKALPAKIVINLPLSGETTELVFIPEITRQVVATNAP